MMNNIWVEHYEFDDLKNDKSISIEMMNYNDNLKVDDIVLAQSCYKESIIVKVVNIESQFCSERDIITFGVV